MIIIHFNRQFDFEYDLQGIIRSFYPGEPMKSVQGEKTVADRSPEAASGDQDLVLFCDFDDKKMSLGLQKDGKMLRQSVFEKVYTDGNYDRKETKNRLKRELYELLSEETGKHLAWGTLSGIRPTKITSALLMEGKSDGDIFAQMKRDYYLSDSKAEESIRISKRELEILDRIDYRNGYSLYIGIPFCPSTCLYCSFTSYPVGLYRNRIDLYLDALFREIDFVRERYAYKRLCTIYIGGGTPTALNEEQLKRLLAKVKESFDLPGLYEFTVEAGRPDSITSEKLRILKQYGVTRISINPQTMSDETLKLIGRHHTVAQFLDAYHMARELGFDNINMDFILGLPGEDAQDVRNSMAHVRRLKPDSLTIHSLAVKRAARLNLEQRAGRKFEIHNSEELMQITRDTAAQLSLEPYYLYRQKNMAGNLENVGYARKGKEGIYNILIMEEKQTILALGAGSSSKMVWRDSDRIDRIENVKDVNLYIEKIDEMIERKRRYMDEYQF